MARGRARARAAHRRARHPRRRGGGPARRPRRVLSPRPGAGRRGARRRPRRGRASAPTPRSSRCASARCARSRAPAPIRAREARCGRAADPPRGGCSPLRCSARGSCTSTSRASKKRCSAGAARDRRRAVGRPRPAGAQPRCSPPRRSCSAWRSRSPWASRSPSRIHLCRSCAGAVYPLLVGSQAIPIPVIASLLVFWWGFGMFPKLVVIALICFFPVVVTTVDGLGAVDPEQLKLLRTLDASRWQVVPLRRAAGGAAGGAQRRADRARGGGDRRVHRRDHDAQHRRLPGLGPRDQSTRHQLPDRPRVRGHGACCSPSRSPASTRSRSPSAGSRRGARRRPGERTG